MFESDTLIQKQEFSRTGGSYKGVSASNHTKVTTDHIPVFYSSERNKQLQTAGDSPAGSNPGLVIKSYSKIMIYNRPKEV